MSGQGTFAFTDSWGDGCPRCRQLAPVIDVLACEYAGKIKIGKLDIAANGATAMRYRVQSIPTLLLFKGGQVVAERMGSVGKSDLAKMIGPHL